MPTLEIFLALFIFILVVLVSIEDIATGFLLLLMLVPLQHKELFSLVVWDVLPIRIAFFGLFLTTFYRFYLWFRRYREKEVILKFVKDPILILLFALYVTRVISLFFAENKVDGLQLLAFYTTVVYFYLLIKFLYLHYGYKSIEKALLIYGILGFVTSIISFIQFYSFKIFNYKFGAIWDIPGHNPRVGSTFWDVNHYGAYVASLIPISIALFIHKKGVFKYFWALNSLLLCAALYITQSRSAWLGIAISLLFFVYFLFIKGFKKYAKLVTIVSLLGILSLITYFEFSGPGLVEKYKSFMHTRLDSFDTHFILLKGAYEVYTKNPIIGAGYGNFNEAFRKTESAKEYFFRERYIGDGRVPSHSIWGEVLAETGFTGFLFYTLVFFTALVILIKGYLQSAETSSIQSLGLAAGILAFLISGIFYTYNQEFFWFLLFFGVLTGYHYNPNLSIKGFFEWLHSIKNLPLLYLAAFSSFLLFWDLSKNKLIDWDEAIYASVSKNIVLSGDWLTLQWTLGTPWLEKPPLYMWISAGLMKMFGFGEFAARFPSALFGLLGVILVYTFAKYIFKSRLAGMVSGLMLITTAHYLYYARNGMLDVTVTFFIMLSLYFGYRFFEEKNYRSAIFSGIACGLAIMTKAIIGLLPLPILLIYSLYLVFRIKYNRAVIIRGARIFLITAGAISVPWHLGMYFLHGEDFVDTYLKQHILNRGLTNEQGKFKEFWWYLEVIKVSFRGWTLILIPALVFAIQKAFKGSKEYIFLLISTLVLFFFFSISNSKLIWYIIPIYPVLALISSGLIKYLFGNLSKYLYFSLYIFVLGSILYFSLDKINFYPFFIYTFFVLFSILKRKAIIVYLSGLRQRLPLAINAQIEKLPRMYSRVTYIGVFTVFICLFMFWYVLGIQDLVYYIDFNKDLVSTIEAYNEKYAETSGSVKRLYYLRISPPVVKFYTEGETLSSDVETFKETIKKAPFDESLAYISRQGEVSRFQNLYSSERVVISENRGAYYLMYVRSLEEYYNARLTNLRAALNQKILEYPYSKNKMEILDQIKKLEDEIFNLGQILYDNLPDKYTPPLKIRFNG